MSGISNDALRGDPGKERSYALRSSKALLPPPVPPVPVRPMSVTVAARRTRGLLGPPYRPMGPAALAIFPDTADTTFPASVTRGRLAGERAARLAVAVVGAVAPRVVMDWWRGPCGSAPATTVAVGVARGTPESVGRFTGMRPGLRSARIAGAVSVLAFC